MFILQNDLVLPTLLPTWVEMQITLSVSIPDDHLNSPTPAVGRTMAIYFFLF